MKTLLMLIGGIALCAATAPRGEAQVNIRCTSNCGVETRKEEKPAVPEPAPPSCRSTCVTIQLDFIPKSERNGRTQNGYQRLTVPQGAYGVEGHGTPRHMICSKGRPLSAEDVARFITNDRRYTKGATVYLLSCNTGKGPSPFAQEVADVLRTTVVAPTERLWVHRDGTYSVCREARGRFLGLIPYPSGRVDPNARGCMKSFKPRPASRGKGDVEIVDGS
jgi:hypothetical protein